MKKLILSLFIFLSFEMFGFAQVVNDTQIVYSDSWVYDAMYKLGKESKTLGFYENKMLSVGELKFYLKQIDKESLSASGQDIYNSIENFLYGDGNILNKFAKDENKDPALSFYTNLRINPEFYFKSNENIPWSFNYFYNENLLTIPLEFGVSDYFTISVDPFVGKSHLGSSKPDSICNIPYRDDDPEFMFIRFANGSTGLFFDNWGTNLTIGKQGLQIGNTKLGSIFLNDTFETDSYLQYNLFTNDFKYSGNIIQVDYSKYLYLHQIECILFDNFKLGVMEGSLLCQPAELRFANPLMFMHQYAAASDYTGDVLYSQENFCAYFGLLSEWTPFKNTRLYAIYAQNEIQIASERAGVSGDVYPDSLGVQFGVDSSIPTSNDGYWNFGGEFSYTSPYLYIKHTPQNSLYRSRHDNLSSDFPNSWVGSPYGPDCMAGQVFFGYEKVGKWKADFTYNLIAKGENDFSMFNNMEKINQSGDYYNGLDEEHKNRYKDEDFYAYYPPNMYKLGNKNIQDVLDIAHNMKPSGIVQYTNQFILQGEYKINQNWKFNAKGMYSFVLNSNHIENQFEQGVEIALSMTYNLF